MSKPNANFSLPLGDRDEAPSDDLPRQAASSAVAGRKPAKTNLEREWEQLDALCKNLQARIATDRKRHKAVFRTEDRLVKIRLKQMLLEQKIEQRARSA